MAALHQEGTIPNDPRRIPDMNGRQLRKLFQEFNGRYFGGRLPEYAIRVVPSITWLNEGGYCYRKRKLIKIRNGQSVEETVTTLLHEMAHAATPGFHGMPWKKEMIRLRKAGAPLSAPDNQVSLEDWSGDQVSKQHFRGVMQEVVPQCPTIGLTQAIRWFIYEEGGPPTVSSFLKQCPWAREVLNQVKREYAKNEARRLRFTLEKPVQRLQPTDGIAGLAARPTTI